MFSSRHICSPRVPLPRFAGAAAASAFAAALLQGCLLAPVSGAGDAEDSARGSETGSLSEWLSSHTPLPPGMEPAQAAADDGRGGAVPEAPGDDPVLRTGYAMVVSVSVGDKTEVEPTVVQVSDRNEVSLPLIGKVDCTDLSLNAFRSLLATRYGVYYVNPEVTASFIVTDATASPWGSVLVQGRVLREGWVNIPASRDLTVTRAIQMAGGFAPSASKDDIAVHRTGPDGTRRKIKVDVQSIGRKGKLENDILLQAGDVINVYESNF